MKTPVCSFLVAFVMSLPVQAQPKRVPTVVACPVDITVSESVAPIAGWMVGAQPRQRSFERISIYNRDAEGREYDLAPDSQQEANRITQTWNLKDYRTMGVFLRCRYRDTTAVLSMELPPVIAACTFSYVSDSHGGVAAKPKMDCR